MLSPITALNSVMTDETKAPQLNADTPLRKYNRKVTNSQAKEVPACH
jgi:hypothetical protein